MRYNDIKKSARVAAIVMQKWHFRRDREALEEFENTSVLTYVCMYAHEESYVRLVPRIDSQCKAGFERWGRVLEYR